MAIQYFNWARTKIFCRFFSQTSRKIQPRFVNTNEGEGRQTECLNSSLKGTFMMMQMYEFISVCFTFFSFTSEVTPWSMQCPLQRNNLPALAVHVPLPSKVCKKQYCRSRMIFLGSGSGSFVSAGFGSGLFRTLH